MGNKRSKIKHSPPSSGLAQMRLTTTQPHHYGILMLGAGSVGKSTILKSIESVKQCYQDERHSTPIDARSASQEKAIIRANCIQCILLLCRELLTLNQPPIVLTDLNLHFNTYGTDYGNAMQTITSYTHESFETNLDYIALQSLANAIRIIWQMNKIQEIYKLHMLGKYSIPCNMDHFLNKIERIMSKYYIPSKEDYYKLRCRTTGLIRRYYIDDKKINKFCIYEYGGQRGERAKWIHVFPKRYIIFVVGLDQFCKCLFEDSSTNGLLENMQIFKELLHKTYTKNMQFVLFFTKIDLFKQCLKVTDLSIVYGNMYKGIDFNTKRYVRMIWRVINELMLQKISGINADDIAMEIIFICGKYYGLNELFMPIVYKHSFEFIKERFMELNEDKNRKISVYEIEMMNTNQIANIMSEIETMIISKQRVFDSDF